jgi:hypothetical protein
MHSIAAAAFTACAASMPNSTLDHEERPEALAASEQRMPHGGAKARAFARALRLKQRIEPLLGKPGRVSKPLHNPH